jgi:hypothetical protein
MSGANVDIKDAHIQKNKRRRKINKSPFEAIRSSKQQERNMS